MKARIMNTQLLTVFKKEMRDMLRDRRGLFSAFSFAFLGPLFFVFLSMIIPQADTVYTQNKIQVAGAEYAPGLVRSLENANYEILLVPELSETVDEKSPTLPDDVEGLIVIDKNFQSDIERGEQGGVTLYTFGSSPKKIRQSRNLISLVREYGNIIVAARFISRGIPLSLADAIDLQVSDLAEESFASQYLGDIITIIFVMAPFIASMGVAIDTLAGERERNSFQSLLAQPVSGRNIVLGKWMMVSAFGLTGTLLSCLIYFVVFQFIDIASFPISMHFSPFIFLIMIFILTPLAMFVASLQMYISIQVKSFKEGQTYVSLLTIAPMLIGYIKAFASDRLPDWIIYLPVFSHIESLAKLLFNNQASIIPILISVGVSLLGTVILVALTGKRIDSERLLDEV